MVCDLYRGTIHIYRPLDFGAGIACDKIAGISGPGNPAREDERRQRQDCPLQEWGEARSKRRHERHDIAIRPAATYRYILPFTEHRIGDPERGCRERRRPKSSMRPFSSPHQRIYQCKGGGRDHDVADCAVDYGVGLRAERAFEPNLIEWKLRDFPDGIETGH